MIKRLLIFLHIGEPGLKIFSLKKFNFIAKRSGPYDGSVSLTKDLVYILPTKSGLIFSVLLLILLIGSINYEKSLGFLLTFLLVGFGNIILLASWRNMAGIHLKRTQTKSVFAGEKSVFSVQLCNPQSLHRYSLAISYQGKEYDVVDCPANANQLICFHYQAEKRGLIKPGKFKLYTEFPTGLFIAWTWIDLNMSGIVYPRPDKKVLSLYGEDTNKGEIDLPGKGSDNFSHLRKYQYGDNVKQVSWKVAAKNEVLYTKEFSGSQLETRWIKWQDVKARDDEKRLSIMAAYIVNAERDKLSYGVELPQCKIFPDSGNKHYHECLTALALYGK